MSADPKVEALSHFSIPQIPDTSLVQNKGTLTLGETLVLHKAGSFLSDNQDHASFLRELAQDEAPTSDKRSSDREPPKVSSAEKDYQERALTRRKELASLLEQLKTNDKKWFSLSNSRKGRLSKGRKDDADSQDDDDDLEENGHPIKSCFLFRWVAC